MKLKQLSSVAVASLITASSISLANEVNIPINIKNENVKEGKTSTLPSQELPLNGDNCSVTISSNVTISGRNKFRVETPENGKLTLRIKATEELRTSSKTMRVRITNPEVTKIVDHVAFQPKSYYSSSNNMIELNFVLPKGVHNLEVTYQGTSVSTTVNANFIPYTNSEIEANFSKNLATEIILGKEYYVIMHPDDCDGFKVSADKDTRTKIQLQPLSIKAKSNSKQEYKVLSENDEELGELILEDSGLYTAEVTLKAGYNYIDLTSTDYETEYLLKVDKLYTINEPVLDTVSDNKNYISGKVERDVTNVYVKVGTEPYQEANIHDEGAFKLNLDKTLEAGTPVSAYAVYSSGDISQPTETICVDKTAPNKPTVEFKIANKEVILSGTTEAKATVRCTLGTSGKVIEKKADNNGKYKISIKDIKPGESVSIEAIDLAGNKSAAFKGTPIKTVAVPKVNNLSNIHTKVTGTATKGHTVYVKIGSKYYKSKVDSKGKYSVTIPKQKYKTVLKVYAKDKNGYNSKVVSKKVGYAPKKPTVKAITTKSTKIIGKSSKNATITVKIGSKTYKGTTSPKGNFTIKIPKQKKGTQIKIQAKFASTGFSSYTTTVKVK